MNFQKRAANLLANYIFACESGYDLSDLATLLGGRTFGKSGQPASPTSPPPQYKTLAAQTLAQAVHCNNRMFALPIYGGVVKRSQSLIERRNGCMLLDTASHEAMWRECLASMDTAYALASLLLRAELALSEGDSHGYPLRQAVNAIMLEWAGDASLYCTNPGVMTLAGTLFGDMWCTCYLDPAEWRIPYNVTALRPRFLNGLVPAQGAADDWLPQDLPDLDERP